MQKINETGIGKNQIVGEKVLIFQLHYIAMHFTDTKFHSKESVTTQTFTISRLKKQISKSSS